MKKFKIRCSAIGKIMTNPRKKSEKLSETTKTYLQEWLKEQIYGVKNFNGSKYTEKGIEVEDDSINYLSLLDGQFYLKNEESFENEYLTGTPDIIPEKLIIDVKNSWNMFTFPLFDQEPPNQDYVYQLQGYMCLTDKEEAELVYLLMNTPDELLNPWNDIPYDYTYLEDKYRVKRFRIKRDDELIKKIEQRVKDCREYIQELLDGLHK